MHLRGIIIGIAVAFLAGVVATAARGEDPAPPETVTIDGCKDKKPAVTFTHKAHADRAAADGKDCTSCHHNGGAGSKCTECHQEAKGDIGTCKESSPSKNPFHIKCRGCHKDGGKGPTKCNDCHKEG